MIRETFEVDVLAGHATVRVSVAITTTFVGGDDELTGEERRIARQEAVEFVQDVIREAVAESRADYHGPALPDAA